MPTQDTKPIKEKIINFLKARGPSLPVQIARETGMNSLFASAFLSELISEKQIKTSIYMRLYSVLCVFNMFYRNQTLAVKF